MPPASLVLAALALRCLGVERRAALYFQALWKTSQVESLWGRPSQVSAVLGSATLVLDSRCGVPARFTTFLWRLAAFASGGRPEEALSWPAFSVLLRQQCAQPLCPVQLLKSVTCRTQPTWDTHSDVSLSIPGAGPLLWIPPLFSVLRVSCDATAPHALPGRQLSSRMGAVQIGYF